MATGSEPAPPQPAIRQRKRPAAPPRAIDLSAREGTIDVERLHYNRSLLVATETRAETVRVPIFHTAPARVRVEGGVTRNMGDYNSVRVCVTIEVPCNPEESEIRSAHKFASDLVDELVCDELDRATAQPEAH